MIWRRSRRRLYGALAACALVVASAAPPAAEARPVHGGVVRRRAGHGVQQRGVAAVHVGLPGSPYAVCPSQGSLNAGISDRITGVTVPGLAFSGHTFTAPPGSRIAGLRWGGRFARGDCHWGAFLLALPSTSMIFGLARNAQCASTGIDIRGTPLAFAVPQGTTGLQQVIVCGAPSCGPGADVSHNRGRGDDRGPDGAAGDRRRRAGGWTLGSRGPADNRQRQGQLWGIAKTWATIGSDSVPTAWPCRYTNSRPCADQAGPIVLPTGRVASGLQQVLVGAQDAAGNVTYAEYTACGQRTAGAGAARRRGRRCLATLGRLCRRLAHTAPRPTPRSLAPGTSCAGHRPVRLARSTVLGWTR